MKIKLTFTTIQKAQNPKRSRARLPGESRTRLPGEPRPFTPMSRRTARQLNLTPPQHLAPDGAITSTRSQEVERSTLDPWAQRIHDLEAQVQALEVELHKLRNPE